MTICIAAICAMSDDSQGVVLCTDWRGSSFVGFSDEMLKSRRIGPGWYCLTAGRESDIVALYNSLWPRFVAQDRITEVEAPGIVRQAVEARKLEKADDYIRGKYGLSWKDFLTVGKDKFPPDLFRAAIEDVRSIDLGADFIVVGFDLNFPFLITISADGKVQVRDEMALVGEGQFLAQASLLSRSYTSVMKLPVALYCVYEAKKAAERVTSVGEGTTLFVMGKDKRYTLSKSGKEKLQALYAKHGPQALPEDSITFPDSALIEKAP